MVILMMRVPISKGEIFNGEDFIAKSVDEAKEAAAAELGVDISKITLILSKNRGLWQN